MIFPPIRISQLSHDLELKRTAFDRSKDRLTQNIKRKLSPINILKEHPQLWVGAAMSLLSAGGLGKLVTLFGSGKNGHSKNGHGSKSGILASLLKFGGRTAVRTVAPVAINAMKFVLKSAFRSFRSRRSRPDSEAA